MTAAPVIETARLTLRPHRAEDFAPYAAFFASGDARYMGGPVGEREAWFWFASDVAQWSLYGCGAWAIEERETRAFAGQVTVNRAPMFPETELGWLVFDGFRGRGYATEAAAAARDWAQGALGGTLVSYVHPENGAAEAVATRLGAAPDPAARAHAPAFRVWRHVCAEAA